MGPPPTIHFLDRTPVGRAPAPTTRLLGRMRAVTTRLAASILLSARLPAIRTPPGNSTLSSAVLPAIATRPPAETHTWVSRQAWHRQATTTRSSVRVPV